MKMLYSHRKAYASMPWAWRPVHRVLWFLYSPLARFAAFRRLWGLYRRTWP